ncbi:MAG: hypothetical protein J0L97_00990 [Alphaproteobacteria bacterium]|nr:hypothetical protein [Alphaproteobacteria bacterium]
MEERMVDISELISPDALITVTARLAQLLAEEADLLREMKIKELDKLKEEKLRLVNAMERQQKLMKDNPQIAATFSAEDKERIMQVMKLFREVRDEGFHRLTVAREVNRIMMQAIHDVVAESRAKVFYDKKGSTEDPSREASLSVNEEI